MIHDVDFLVIGSGLAGLTYALNVAPRGSVAVLTKKTRSDANSSWAQGGIAGVLADDDSFELHKQDTLIAGAGLCHEDAVEVLVSEGPERIRDLIQMGANFDTRLDEEGNRELALGREGGHSRNRIVHTADFTGWECERTLLEAVKTAPNIAVYEHFFVTDLAIADTPEGRVCVGAFALDSETGESVAFRAKATLLATGGCGHVYQHTTNPLVATGDGVAMAWRAGAAIANMEFIQFHPTTLYHPKARAFLITEALRGEGGILRHAVV
jgi:L-aspartate oxidase